VSARKVFKYIYNNNNHNVHLLAAGQRNTFPVGGNQVVIKSGDVIISGDVIKSGDVIILDDVIKSGDVIISGDTRLWFKDVKSEFFDA